MLFIFLSQTFCPFKSEIFFLSSHFLLLLGLFCLHFYLLLVVRELSYNLCTLLGCPHFVIVFLSVLSSIHFRIPLSFCCFSISYDILVFENLKDPIMSCSSSDPPAFCSDASPELKLYQAFIFSVPVFFTFILLVLFYVFYLRRRRANWASLRMRTSYQSRGDLPRLSESGIKKEVREMLPVVVFKESFLIRETQCSVCLGDYKSDEHLKRIPPCGHTFHVDCIDHWLSTHTTCPLCRVSLIPAAKATAEAQNPASQADDFEGQPDQVVRAEEQTSQRDGDGHAAHQGSRTELERHSTYEELVCPRRGTEHRTSEGESFAINVESLAEREGITRG
uniref:RING-type E3 ubiquitin transferase n=2 Tax=Anthurium amnicola TaxID=1678845 RepID=A0A1D1YC74_9ARAE